ncbi:hypothetical protein EVAR_97009_1 [Eumeta japonica]|uniref:Uncharacterized protein n=1 Tax=Eumeta variegata TaxID=151549 RepID=A0A4C1T5A9_EUMVA|nr:hypothetical protein EVAR_97009_1 [Eumeta japonica]
MFIKFATFSSRRSPIRTFRPAISVDMIEFDSSPNKEEDVKDVAMEPAVHLICKSNVPGRAGAARAGRGGARRAGGARSVNNHHIHY